MNPAIPYVDLVTQHRKLLPELMEAIEKVLLSGNFILGEAVSEFEERFSQYVGARYAVGVADASEGLLLALKAVGVRSGDEVIVPANSFLSSAASVAALGAVPVFIDTADDLNLDVSQIESLINKKTKAIMPVHLTGRAADMKPIMELARKHGLRVVEDAAQAVGAKYFEKAVGNFGDVGVFSMHPLKNLGACGDGGCIVTNDSDIHSFLRQARNNGLKNRDECEFWSIHSRLDSIQAAILNVKLKYLDAWTAQRRAHAKIYQSKLSKYVETPVDLPHQFAVYEKFVIQSDHRDSLQAYLKDQQVATAIHYPIPLHLQKAAQIPGYQALSLPRCERQTKRILSLPVYQWLSQEQVESISEQIATYFERL